MIRQALRDKLCKEGACGFVRDAAELGASMLVIGTWCGIVAATSLVAFGAGLPLVALELLAKPRPPTDGTCDCGEERRS